MKRQIFTPVVLYCAMLSILLIAVESFAQRAEVVIWQTNNASTSEVSIYIKNTGSLPVRLGFGSFVINYNFSAMNTPVEFSEGLWDNNNNSSYDDQSVAEYNANRSAAIEIGLTGPVQGLEVPSDSVLLGTISFTILIPTLNHNIQWNNIYTSVFDDNGNDITDSITFVDPANSLLPVELISFSSSVRFNDVHLQWSTSEEMNNLGFDVERTEAGNSAWQSVGFVEGSLNSSEIRNYTFTDEDLSLGTYQYRLKQKDINGNFEYFELREFVSVSAPQSFSLLQNYPNPFNPTTVIKFETPASGNAELILYDISGRMVRKLIDQYLEAGYHSYTLNADGLSSGAYYYRLVSEQQTATKILTVIK